MRYPFCPSSFHLLLRICNVQGFPRIGKSRSSLEGTNPFDSMGCFACGGISFSSNQKDNVPSAYSYWVKVKCSSNVSGKNILINVLALSFMLPSIPIFLHFISSPQFRNCPFGCSWQKTQKPLECQLWGCIRFDRESTLKTTSRALRQRDAR